MADQMLEETIETAAVPMKHGYDETAESGHDHTEVEVKRGEDATLQCHGPTGAAITLLEWSRPDLTSDGYVLFYRNNRLFEKYHHDSFRGRVELRDPFMTDEDVSVILRNTNVGDTGTYECLITASDTGSGDGVLSEFKHTVGLTVIDDEGDDDGGDDDGGDIDGGDYYGGYSDGCLSLKASLSFCAMLLAVLVLL